MAMEGISMEGKEIKRDERQTTRNIYVHETKRGRKEVMLREKGEESKESFDKQNKFNSIKNSKNGILISGKFYLTL